MNSRLVALLLLNSPAKAQERLAVDDQLGGCPLLPQVRDLRSRADRSALALTRNQGERAHESGAKQVPQFHGYLLRILHRVLLTGQVPVDSAYPRSAVVTVQCEALDALTRPSA